MKKAIISLVTLTGMATAGTLPEAAITALNNTYGTFIGASINNAQKTSSPITGDSTYNELISQLTTENTWFVNSDVKKDIGESYAPSQSAVTLVAGGPGSDSGVSAVGAIKFTVTAGALLECEGPLTLSFDVALTTQGNNNKNHVFTFSILSSTATVSTSYNSKDTTTNQLSTTATNVALTFSEAQVEAMKSANQDFVLRVATDPISGSNKGIVMSNFKMEGISVIPEPATATLSLLALAGLAVRRRRK